MVCKLKIDEKFEINLKKITKITKTKKSNLYSTIKSRDTRCGVKCLQNWTKYKQKPIIGSYCVCTKLIRN
jgi:hypothetical protein